MVVFLLGMYLVYSTKRGTVYEFDTMDDRNVRHGNTVNGVVFFVYQSVRKNIRR
jgi:hypothetical protein